MSFLSFALAAAALFGIAFPAQSSASSISPEAASLEAPSDAASDLPSADLPDPVPFYSQFKDIHSTRWQKVGCGIASLAMVLDYHRPGSFASVDALLEEGIKKEAYLESAGWTYAGLISVARPYGFSGESRDIAGASDTAALSALREALQRGPVIVSVYYTFEPGNPIPHLVVVSSIDGDTVRYNDPAEPSGNGSMSLERFMKAWKKRYIEIYPVS